MILKDSDTCKIVTSFAESSVAIDVHGLEYLFSCASVVYVKTSKIVGEFFLGYRATFVGINGIEDEWDSYS